MLQVAVGAAPAAATPPAPLLLLLAASSCHCSWLWFSDCIAQDFNATVFARRVSWLAGNEVDFPAYARCGTRMQAQDADAVGAAAGAASPAPAPASALALLPIAAISRIQYK